MARLLHGRPLAERIRGEARTRVEALKASGVTPTLTVFVVGPDPASNAYLERLGRAGTALGIGVDGVNLAATVRESELIDALEERGDDPSVNAILLLTPLPGALDEMHVVDHIAVRKDVEGMHPFNLGFLADGRPRFVPSTAEAIVELLKYYDVPLRGARALVIGRSTVIGRPAAYLLLKEDATVTIAHKQTVDLERFTREADIVVVGVGRAGFLRGDMLSPGVTVIDAGINLGPAGLVGDVDLESVGPIAAALSPVPGGLGAVTTALLLRNVVTATERQLKKR